MTGEPTEQELIALGVYDPSAPDAAEMVGFIRKAMADGVTLDELVEFGPSFAAVKRALRPGERVTLAEAARRVGVSIDTAHEILRAVGLARPGDDVEAFTAEDVELIGSLSASVEIFGPDLANQLMRTVGSATARIAEAAISQFSVDMARKGSAKPLTELEIARANEFSVSLLPILLRTIDILLRRHIEARARTDLLTLDDRQGVDLVDRVIGFCDLVGYTSFARAIPFADLDAAVANFGNRASDLVVENGGHVVKLIGDEVMFVTRDAPTAIRIAIALADTFEADPVLPHVRVGLAAGKVMMREGDFYGPVVNLAARIAKIAPPGGILTPASMRDFAPDARYADAGESNLKGFEEPVPVVRVER